MLSGDVPPVRLLKEDFRSWVSKGRPASAGQKRKATEGQPLDSKQRRDVVSKIRDDVVKILGMDLEEQAVAELGSSAKSSKKQQWKKDVAIAFFQKLPEKKQDDISELAEAFRTDTLTDAAGKFLGVSPAPAAAPAPAPSSSSTPNPLNRRNVFAEMSSRHRTDTVARMCQDIVALSPTHDQASRLLRDVQRKWMSIFK